MVHEINPASKIFSLTFQTVVFQRETQVFEIMSQKLQSWDWMVVGNGEEGRENYTIGTVIPFYKVLGKLAPWYIQFRTALVFPNENLTCNMCVQRVQNLFKNASRGFYNKETHFVRILIEPASAEGINPMLRKGKSPRKIMKLVSVICNFLASENQEMYTKKDFFHWTCITGYLRTFLHKY